MTLRSWVGQLRRLTGQWVQRDHQRPPTIGQRGEAAARRYVRHLGWRLVDANTRTRFSELDIVAVDGRTIVFIEVKTRHSDDPDAPLAAVDSRKQQRIVNAALAYLKKHQLLEQSVRFDVIGVSWPNHSEPNIRHIRDAFGSTHRGQFFS